MGEWNNGGLTGVMEEACFNQLKKISVWSAVFSVCSRLLKVIEFVITFTGQPISKDILQNK